MMFGNREVSSVRCQCGGELEDDESTDAEEAAGGCGRKGCCVRPLKCDKCEYRIVFYLLAPEVEIDR